jgi:DNA-binding MarR family transcriptional regulator
MSENKTEEIKATVTEQLQKLQALKHRTYFHGNGASGIKHNPHRGQGRILSLLKIKEEISQRELSYLLDMSKQSLAELLAKLESSGYITRKTSDSDKRILTISLTSEGKKAADEIDDSTAETPKALDCLNDEELQVFSEYLGRIIKSYESQYPDEDFEERRKMMDEFMSSHGRGFGKRGGHRHRTYHSSEENCDGHRGREHNRGQRGHEE